MDSYIIDTNFFFNLEVKTGFGSNAHDVITNFIELAKKLKAEKKVEFFMPASVARETSEFTSNTASEEDIKTLLTYITIKSPDVSKVEFPATIFYTMVDEIRTRSYRGLTVAQEQVEAGAQLMSSKTFENKIEYQKGLGDVITKLRDRYRQATRFNFLDSVADLDLIVLAKELDGYLVSADEGVLRWGRMFGVKEVPAELLLNKLSLVGHEAR